MTPTEKIIEYLEGRMPLSDFYAQILHDEALQAFLEQDASIPPYTNAGNLFLYIMDEDVSKPATDINLRDALSKLLTALGARPNGVGRLVRMVLRRPSSSEPHAVRLSGRCAVHPTSQQG